MVTLSRSLLRSDVRMPQRHPAHQRAEVKKVRRGRSSIAPTIDPMISQARTAFRWTGWPRPRPSPDPARKRNSTPTSAGVARAGDAQRMTGVIDCGGRPQRLGREHTACGDRAHVHGARDPGRLNRAVNESPPSPPPLSKSAMSPLYPSRNPEHDAENSRHKWRSRYSTSNQWDPINASVMALENGSMWVFLP